METTLFTAYILTGLSFICFIGAVYTALNIVFEITSNNENNEVQK